MLPALCSLFCIYNWYPTRNTDLIGQEPGEKVSAGHVVKAMIINGLGMVSQPLYMFPKFFENIACEHLIGPGVKAEYLNDDKLGRVMDKLFLKGLTVIRFAYHIFFPENLKKCIQKYS